ncbi:protein of unknown function [Planifilum fulgidum]|uniref:DUF1850 domain-containing protein n=1 Tax=Planifilum fulgidum TaxID=201973 RepID=A0A1I2RM12_9BACL|nr:DUF1850 domain-containing protein [Planifilum fulgidum]SFG41490.1 protein of unknown function [Planifilum fulgidum]
MKKRGLKPRLGWKKGAALGLLLLLMGFLFAWFSSGWAVLKVVDMERERVVFRRLIRVGETFSMVHTHSITKRPVRETFRVTEDRRIAIVEMEFDRFGANLPVRPEKDGDGLTEFLVRDGKYVVRYDETVYPSLDLRVGQVIARHRLHFDDGTVADLARLAGGGTYVQIRADSLISVVEEVLPWRNKPQK